MNDSESFYEIDLQIEDTLPNTIEISAKATEMALHSAIEETLRQQHVAEAALTVVITTDEEVQQLNRDYRGIDFATDVLSFSNHGTPHDESARDPKHEMTPQLVLPPELSDEQALYLGDIVIASSYAACQAERFERTLTAELQLLAIHGTLHLLGFDHGTPSEEALMWAHQDAVLLALGLAPTDAERSI